MLLRGILRSLDYSSSGRLYSFTVRGKSCVFFEGSRELTVLGMKGGACVFWGINRCVWENPSEP